MPKKKNRTTAKSRLVRTVYQRAKHMLKRMKQEHADGGEITLLKEHNAADKQQQIWEACRDITSRLLFRDKLKLAVSVSTHQEEKLGGQHMETIHYVVLRIESRPKRTSDSDLKILQA